MEKCTFVTENKCEVNMPSSMIRHSGVVTQITKTFIEVEVLAQSSCASCQAKSSCSVSDTQEKYVKVYGQTPTLYSINQQVQVLLGQDKGFEALFWAYLLPFVLVLLSLIISSIFLSEVLSALVSIAILLPYYGVLYLFTAKLKQRLAFQIETSA